MKRRLTKLLLVISLLLANGWFPGQLKAAQLNDTVYINRAFAPLFTSAFYFCSFNSDTSFSRKNVTYKLSLNDTLNITVYNNDTLPHSFTIDNYITSSNTVLPGTYWTRQLHFSQQGTYRFYSALSNGAQLGVSGVILAGYTGYLRYSWNLFDQDSVFSEAFHQQTLNAINNNFRPGVFLINGAAYPQSSFDAETEINAMVGDSIIITIVNSGHMNHSIHFHGYHVKIVDAPQAPQTVGWVKDSFPVKPGSHVTVLLVPDKEGMYPVHDHNLIATTNIGNYPGGMMAMLNIMP
ncbi:MAG: hypothetical protein Fur0041_05400 [Bacteroidia bacterium]